MNKNITPADLNMALDDMARRIKDWETNHPNEIMPKCPKCNNIGLVRKTYDEFGTELLEEDRDKPGSYDYFEPCSCIKGIVNQNMINNRRFATVPGLYADAMFDNFRTDLYSSVASKQLAVCAKNDSIKYVLNFNKMLKNGMGLYIFSNARGSGKSRLASSISNEMINLGIRNKYASASAILSEIQRSWNDKDVSEEKIIKNYVEPKVLIVDDLGARSGQHWMDEKFQMIIDDRYQGNKVTIFTSNYEINSLPFKDMRIIDRLSDVDRFHVIKMPNETVRVKPRNKGVDLFTELTTTDDEN